MVHGSRVRTPGAPSFPLDAVCSRGAASGRRKLPASLRGQLPRRGRPGVVGRNGVSGHCGVQCVGCAHRAHRRSLWMPFAPGNRHRDDGDSLRPCGDSSLGEGGWDALFGSLSEGAAAREAVAACEAAEGVPGGRLPKRRRRNLRGVSRGAHCASYDFFLRGNPWAIPTARRIPRINGAPSECSRAMRTPTRNCPQRGATVAVRPTQLSEFHVSWRPSKALPTFRLRKTGRSRADFRGYPPSRQSGSPQSA